ncbi:MAG: gfo/Idh/MocA family oxidoreductase, partial [Planctomycetota bacterium]
MTDALTRREFLETGTAAVLSQAPLVHAGGQEPTISVGLIGCGGRGTGAAENILEAAAAMNPPVNLRVVALGDVFKDRIDGSRRQLGKHPGFKVTDENCFTGLDAYKRVLDS